MRLRLNIGAMRHYRRFLVLLLLGSVPFCGSNYLKKAESSGQISLDGERYFKVTGAQLFRSRFKDELLAPFKRSKGYLFIQADYKAAAAESLFASVEEEPLRMALDLKTCKVSKAAATSEAVVFHFPNGAKSCELILYKKYMELYYSEKKQPNKFTPQMPF